MSQEHKNCQTCTHAYWGVGGDIQCDFDPHNTDPNGPIARWLCTVYPESTFHTELPCPAWEGSNE